jgi:hypothetical protein
MSILTFAHLYPTGMSPCTLQKEAYAEALNTWLCGDCGAPKPTVGAISVQIQEEEPHDSTLTFISGCGVLLARSAFLKMLGQERVQADLMLGAVNGPSGKISTHWVTVRGRRRLIVRGSKNVSYRRCGACGRHVYFAMGTHYLYPEPTAGVSIHESDLSLVVTSNILKGISLDRWSKVGIDNLAVLPKPKDGLGDLY